MTIAIDFDGTVVRHEYPLVGEDCPFAEKTLKRLVKAGHRLILFTMRHDKELEDAVSWFAERGIPLFGINENPEQKVWTSSPKAYANLYIDDAALGCPLIENGVDRAYVDWLAVYNWLDMHDLFNYWDSETQNVETA